MVIATFKRLTSGGSNGAASNSRRIKKSEIPGNICLMPISVGQDYHVGEKGFATLKLMLDSNFSKIFVIVVDALQALTIMAKEGCSAEVAMRKAIKNGDNWLAWFEEQKRIEPALANLPIEVIRWSIYTEDAIRDERTVVDEWHRENFNSFRKTLGSTAANFLRGAVGQSDDVVDGDRVALYFNNSAEYLKRETAVAIKWQSQFVLANAEKTVFLAYPKEPNPIIEFVLNRAEPPYKLEVEVLVIRFNSPKLSAKKISPSAFPPKEEHEHEDDVNGKGANEYLSSDSDGGGSPPEPSFIGVQAELEALRLQVGAIPALQEQLQQTTAKLQDTTMTMQTLQFHVMFLYQNYVATGAGNLPTNGTFVLPPPDRKLTPPLPSVPTARPEVPPPASLANGVRPVTPPPS